jgi:maleate isomerase
LRTALVAGPAPAKRGRHHCLPHATCGKLLLPMTDALGFRKKFGVIAPSTNTSVQPEFEAMRPRGVTNHFGRIHIPNAPIRNDDDFNQLMDNIRKQMLQAVDDVMTCEPDYLIMGMSSETFWDGLEGSKKLHERVEARAGVKVSMGSDAARAALQRYGAKRVGVITPYMPVGDAQVRRFFADCGFEVVRLKGLKCASPVLIAHVPERELRDAILDVDGPEVDAVIQVGTNLAMARLAGIAEFWLDKPVLAINTCIYWWSLRQNGINDKIDGFGSLLLEH